MTQLRHRPGLDLANALTGEVEVLADLFERARTAVLETETKPYDLLLPIAQLDQHIPNSRGQQVTSGNVDRGCGIFVLDDGVGLVAKRVDAIPNTRPRMLRLSSDNPAYSNYQRRIDWVMYQLKL